MMAPGAGTLRAAPRPRDRYRLGGDGGKTKASPSARLQLLLTFFVIGDPKLAAFGLGLFFAERDLADGRPEG
jgi:hypothetical protein